MAIYMTNSGFVQRHRHFIHLCVPIRYVTKANDTSLVASGACLLQFTWIAKTHEDKMRIDEMI